MFGRRRALLVDARSSVGGGEWGRIRGATLIVVLKRGRLQHCVALPYSRCEVTRGRAGKPANLTNCFLWNHRVVGSGGMFGGEAKRGRRRLCMRAEQRTMASVCYTGLDRVHEVNEAFRAGVKPMADA